MLKSNKSLKGARALFSFLFVMVLGTAVSQEADPGSKAASNAQAKDEKVVVNTNTTSEGQEVTNNKVSARSASNSVKIETHETAPLPYDVDDIYMGRKEEFKKLFKTNELPADFPIYEKQYGWGLREYNAVVGAYLENHKDILSEAVKNKLAKAK